MKKLLDAIFYGAVKKVARDQAGASGLEYAALVVVAVALIALAGTAVTWVQGRFGAI